MGTALRNVYFSFHYADIWKVNQIRNSGVVFGPKAAGFVDRSIKEEAKTKHDAALRKLIAEGLEGTTVTAVLIGQETAGRRWVQHEIQASKKKGNALLGIHINRVPSQNGRITRRGRVPNALKTDQSLVREWSTVHEFRVWVEEAFEAKNRKPAFWERLWS